MRIYEKNMYQNTEENQLMPIKLLDNKIGKSWKIVKKKKNTMYDNGMVWNQNDLFCK